MGQFNQRFHIPIGFNYCFLDTTFDSLGIETSGRLVFDKNHYYYADAFSEISMQDKGYPSETSESQISYKNLEIDTGSILIIQFKNITYKKDTSSSANFQIWLYEKNGIFELHMGENTIVDKQNAFLNGPYFGMQKVLSFQPLVFDYKFSVFGNVHQPSTIVEREDTINPFQYQLENIPEINTVYRMNNAKI